MLVHLHTPRAGCACDFDLGLRRGRGEASSSIRLQLRAHSCHLPTWAKAATDAVVGDGEPQIPIMAYRRLLLDHGRESGRWTPPQGLLSWLVAEPW
jgi:hypothetical protein